MPPQALTIAANANTPNSSPSSSDGTNDGTHSDGIAQAIKRLKAATSAGTPVVISCAHTLEGVLAAIGITYLAHADPSLVRLSSGPCCQPQLGEEVLAMPHADDGETVALAKRVYDGLARAISSGCARVRNGACPAACDAACVRKVVYACANDKDDMPEVLHRFARLAFQERARIRTLATHPQVVAIDELARHTLNECERTRQFMRFSRLGDGSFVATFRPKANTIPLTATHFANRLRSDRFCIVDPIHLVAAFHEVRERRCTLVLLDAKGAEDLSRTPDLSDDELYVQAMWKRFYDALALPGRDAFGRGYDLRAQWIPKRLWRGLPELQP